MKHRANTDPAILDCEHCAIAAGPTHHTVGDFTFRDAHPTLHHFSHSEILVSSQGEPIAAVLKFRCSVCFQVRTYGRYNQQAAKSAPKKRKPKPYDAVKAIRANMTKN